MKLSEQHTEEISEKHSSGDITESDIAAEYANRPGQDWRAMSTALRGFLARRVPADLVDDLLQECLAKIVEKLPTLRNPERLDAWIFQIARRAVIDLYRARDKENLPLDFEVESPPADGPNESHQPEVLRELSECVRPMLDSLKEPYRRTVLLADLEGLSHARIALRENISLAGVRSRLARGRAMLKQHFEQCCHFQHNAAGELYDYNARDEKSPATTNHCGCAE